MIGLFKLRNELIENGIIFSFSGTLSQNIISSIAETFEEKMQKSNIKFSLIQNIFSVFIEQIQNILSYSNHLNDFSIIAIGFNKHLNKYYVLSGNMIGLDKKDKIKDRIEKVNSMDKKELRTHYKELRKSGKDTHKRGAGLGFVEMAKKSTEPIEFMFEDFDDKFTFFTLKVII